MNDEEIIEGVLTEFAHLAKIPRPSGHEKNISDFLRDRLTGLGFQVNQDRHFNLIADKPATPGFENAPCTILQGHLDMVCVAEENRPFNPLTDPIMWRREGDVLTAEGTSLGADDGIGIAIGIFILKNAKNHGPLRLIATTDEERGMSGAINLAPEFLSGAKYLINCDSENYDLLINGSAGGIDIEFKRAYSLTQPSYSHAWRLSVGKLLGGHSGEDIGKNRANAIKILSSLLADMESAGEWELAEFTGGQAKNVIPSTASATIVTNIKLEKLEQNLREARQKIVARYALYEPRLEICLEEVELPKQVADYSSSRHFAQTICAIHSGVFDRVDKLVETSSNLGTAKFADGVSSVSIYARSFLPTRLEEIGHWARNFAALNGFELLVGKPSPCWQERTDSHLAQVLTAIFQKQNGRPMNQTAIHAGLECGWLREKNPSMEAVSIGATVKNIHSTKETLFLNTIPPQVKLIMATLTELAKSAVPANESNQAAKYPMLTEFVRRHPDLQETENAIAAALDILLKTYCSGGKLLICGNGGSAADAEHIVGELMKGFLLPRPLTDTIKEKIKKFAPQSAEYLCQNLQMALPAISLVNSTALGTAFANDQAPDLTFAQQVLGLGEPGDTLMGISTSGNSANVLYAVQTARALGLHTIALTGKDGGRLKELADISIVSPASETYLIQEHHLPIYHLICAALEREFDKYWQKNL